MPCLMPGTLTALYMRTTKTSMEVSYNYHI